MVRSQLRRYVLRRDLVRRVRTETRVRLVRRLRKDAWRDIGFVLEPASVRQVFDVGANVGSTAASMLEAFPQADVVCCEADPRSQLVLRERFAGEPRVDLVPRAVADTSGATVSFYVTPTGVTSSLLRPLGEVGSSRVDLQACKLEYSIVSPK